jgi:nitrogen fixation NifU-like protein
MNENLYDDSILRLADTRSHQGIMENPDREAAATTALCGDRVSIQLKMDGRTIERLLYQVRGCLLCRASCADLARVAAGLDRARLQDLRDILQRFLKLSADEPMVPPHLHVFESVRAHRSRHRCVLLPYEAALKALSDAEG